MKYCLRFSGHYTYVNFYSNNKLISRYFLEHFLYKNTELSEDLMYKIFNSNQKTNEIKKYLEKALNDIKKEKLENKNLLFKGLDINLIIFVIILFVISVFIFKHYIYEKNQTIIRRFNMDTPPKIMYFNGGQYNKTE